MKWSSDANTSQISIALFCTSVGRFGVGGSRTKSPGVAQQMAEELVSLLACFFFVPVCPFPSRSFGLSVCASATLVTRAAGAMAERCGDDERGTASLGGGRDDGKKGKVGMAF